MKISFLGLLICSLAVMRCAIHVLTGIPIRIWSDDFPENGPIPCRHTCQCEELSPSLCWDPGPEKTQSYAIIVTDHDAPVPFVTITHWIVYNIPAEILSLPQGATAEHLLENGILQGKRFFGKHGYLGPCPPFGWHHYFFRIYALDTPLNLPPEKATRKRLLKAMQGHVTGYGETVGVYKKK